MSDFDYLARDRAELEASSVAMPCTVTAVDLTGDPRVTIKPMMAIPYDTFDGNVDVDEPLEIAEVPYVYPSGLSFAFIIPPEIGMEGLYIVTDAEIGDSAQGKATSSRRKNASSGYFIPTGRLNDKPFDVSPSWAEMRSKTCRIALSEDQVHLEAGSTSVIVSATGFDVKVGGVSLIDALKQMSTHIRLLEALVHPNGNTHGGPRTRVIDTLSAVAPPIRGETGVR